jgi:hypothetical protein
MVIALVPLGDCTADGQFFVQAPEQDLAPLHEFLTLQECEGIDGLLALRPSSTITTIK